MSTNKLEHPLCLPTVIGSIGQLDRCHTEILGLLNGYPCYPVLRWLLLPQWTCSTLSDASFSDILNTPDSEAPSFVSHAGIPPSCHNLSPTPNFTHNLLPITPLIPDNDTNHSICASNPMNGAFDTDTLIPDESSFFDFGLPASRDDVVFQMPSEPDVPQWIPSDVSLFSDLERLDNNGVYNSLDGFQSYPTIPQPHNSSSVHQSDFASSLPLSMHSGDGSPLLWNEHSQLMGDAESLVCRWNDCGSHLDPKKPEVAKHLQMAHDVKPGGDKLPMSCSWDGCGKPMKKESISRHIVAVHLSKKTECIGCGKQFARLDSKLRHIKNSKRECSDLEHEAHDIKRPRLSCPVADPLF